MLPSHYHAINGESYYGRRPFIRWIALSIILLCILAFISHVWFLLPPPVLEQGPLGYPHTKGFLGPPSSTMEVTPSSTTRSTPTSTTLPNPSSSVINWDKRRDEVRAAFVHAMAGYKKHAFPHDELLALSGAHSNKFNGWGVTLIDSLDTMWLMGLHEDFADAVGFVGNVTFGMATEQDYAHFFETVIRYLGGLLSAYSLSGEPILRSKADDLGRLLFPVFNTAVGLPAFAVNTETGVTRWGNFGPSTLFAEATSCQLEYKYLAKLTGRAGFYEKVERIMDVFYAANVTDGLFPDRWYDNGTPLGGHLTVGATADSGYEYFLKQFLLTGDQRAKRQYLISMEGIINNLLYVTPKRYLLYVTDTSHGYPSYKFEHLSCFLSGLLALGAHTIPEGDMSARTRQLHKWAAHGLGYSCYVLYADQQSGLGPDIVTMAKGPKWVDLLKEWEERGQGVGDHGSGSWRGGNGASPGSNGGGLDSPGPSVKGYTGAQPPGLHEPPPEKQMLKRDYQNSWPVVYLLRPETVESLYILWKTTGEVQWRERGYEIFEAIERHSKTHFGYASVRGVDMAVPEKMDDMPSYFLAETLKYLYLLFDDTDFIDLKKWVFNTEAHPLPVFEWTASERKAFNVSSSS